MTNPKQTPERILLDPELRLIECVACHQTFAADWSEAHQSAAAAEYHATGGEQPFEDLSIVCDDCYRLVMSTPSLDRRCKWCDRPMIFHTWWSHLWHSWLCGACGWPTWYKKGSTFSRKEPKC